MQCGKLVFIAMPGLSITVFESKDDLAAAAAHKAAELIRAAIDRSGRARIVVATGNSQVAMMQHLVRLPDINWQAVEAFHLDEYVGLADTHPASFRLWVKTRFADLVRPGIVHYLNPDGLQSYSNLLAEAPLDLCFVGIGENGHIGFNDPHVADFHDPALLKRVTLDDACRRQQVGEGHFPNLAAVPSEAVTFTCPAVVSAKALVCSVPDLRKAEAVRNAIEGELSIDCPASLLRTHPQAFLYLDTESASLLSNRRPV